MRDETLRAAPFFPRAAAYLLDRLILGVVLLAPKLTLAFQRMGSASLSQAVLFRFTWADILLWCAGAAYFVLLTAFGGATPGKRAMGLAVVNADGETPDFVTVLCRETWARYLSSLLCIGYLLCLADPERGALHDRICDTRVVYAPLREKRQSGHPAPMAPAAAPQLPEGDDDWYAPNR